MNLSRRLVSMPAERIQITMAALLAGAVQVTTMAAPVAPGVHTLDSTMQDEIENDFRTAAGQMSSLP